VPRYLSIGLAALLVAIAASAQTPRPTGKQPAGAAAGNSTGPAPSWIWQPGAPAGQTVAFRKVFEIKGPLSAARLYAAGDDITVSLDDKDVLENRRWDAPTMKDVAEALNSPRTPVGVGKHVLGVRAPANRSASGVLVKLVLESTKGDVQTVVTDGTWRASAAQRRGTWWEPGFDDSGWAGAQVVAKLGDKPFDRVSAAVLDAARPVKEPPATPAESLKIAKGFKVELLYSVPKDAQGSWVSMCVDPKGRLIVSDQYGPLYRVTPPALGGPASDTKVEKLNLPLGGAHGLLWAFDSLYVMVNEGLKLLDGEVVAGPQGTNIERGLYRVRSRDGGNTFESAELIARLQGGGEHGLHAILPSPDGQSLTIICGNQARMVSPLAGSRVPRLWGEDHLLPRMPDGRGFMAGVLGPGGCIYKVDPDGKNWELFCVGFRNEYDAAYNRHGELITYDADMEWDFNTPWYRPTRICLATSGAEFGWRNGAGKWPPYYPDSLPAIYDIGPGSPTGVCFGYGAKFPAKYQEAFFACDWSYGKLYAIHLTPHLSGYKAEAEEFVNGSPLPLTDLVVNPVDGALYFAIGGRKTKSGLYRVTYVGPESTAPHTPPPADAGTEFRAIRHRLEAFHGRQDPAAVSAAWPYLGHEDRFIRFAARVALEFQDPSTWQDRALSETDPAKALAALLALVRVSADDPQHHPKDGRPVDLVAKYRLLDALERLPWDGLSDSQRLDLLRIYAILFSRMGPPDEVARRRLIARLDAHYPSTNRLLNGDLCQMLVYLETPGVATKTLALLARAPTQEEQIDYAKSLRMLKTGWTMDQRRQYFSWFLKAATMKGGASFGAFMANIKRDALATLTEAEKVALQPILDAVPRESAALAVDKPRPFVKKYTVAELAPVVEKGLAKRDFDRGRELFGAAKCFACHRFDGEGGANGPDLTAAAGRFSPRDLLESIIEPSKEISDQYAAVIVETDDGRRVVGRIVNLSGDSIQINPDMLDPGRTIGVDRKRVESIETSKVSMMPEGLLDTLKEDEVLDLVGYLLSRGDRGNAMFKK
jgi:putative heme-binding domain-containing protein